MSQLRVVAASDIHIGNYGSAVDANGVNAAFMSNRRVRQYMLDYCKQIQPDVGIFAGDLYKSAIGRPTQTEQFEAAGFFRDWSEICPVYAKPGNHDVGEFTGEGFGVHALEIFSEMNMRMVVLPKEGWSVVDIAGVRFGLYHGMLANVRLESGMVSDTVRADLSSIHDAPAADLYILGDIHHRQFLAENAAYCGALDRLNFGEEDEVPSFWDITITKDDKTGKVVNIDWKAVATPARKFVTILDEGDVESTEVQDAVVRFVGELSKYTQGELVQLLKKRGALEVTSVADTSELEEAPTLFTSFVPTEAFAIWLEAQTDVSKDLKEFSQQLLLEMTQ